MDRLHGMEVFVAIADAGTLSAAARRLDLPLATVSRRLSDLEALLQARLVTRTTRRMALTDTGRDYLEACRQILEQVTEAERAASGTQATVQGRLAVAAPVVFGRLHVVPVVAEFLQRHPGVDVELRLGDRNVDLLEERIDVAVRIGVLPDSGLVAVRVGGVRRVTCASPAYLRRHGTPRAPEDLGEHTCITFDGLGSANVWAYPTARGDAGRVRVRSRLTVSTADAAVAAAAGGLGVTRVMSYQMLEAERAGKLVRVLAGHEPPVVPVNLVHPGRGRLPMKTRVFIDEAGRGLRERLAGL